MSTKTTYKRIALVAVAALGFGLLSVTPSSAVQQSDTLSLSATSTTITVGSTATTTLTQSFLGNNSDTTTVTLSVVSAPAGNTTTPVLTTTNNGTNGQPSIDATFTTTVGRLMDTVSGAAFATVTGSWTITLPSTALVGTYVIRATPAYLQNGAPVIGAGSTFGTPIAAAQNWTVVVNAAAPAASAAAPDSTSVSEIVPGAVLVVGSTVAVSAAASGSASSAIATIKVVPNVAASAATGSATVSVTVTGPGTLSVPSLTATTSPTSSSLKTTSATLASGPIYVYLFGDGTLGVSTITITMGSVVLTEVAATYGAAASAVATVVKPVIAVGSAATAGAITVLVKDAGGNVVPGAPVWLISGTPTVFATGTAAVISGSTGIASFPLTALVAGTSSFTFSNVAAGSTAAYTSAAVSVRAGSATMSSVTMTFDKASYTPGEVATITVMIKDAAGSLVADGTYAAFAAAVTSTRVLSGSLPTASLTTGSSTGTLTFAINVPTTSGDFTISALGGSTLAAAQAGLAISAMATVTPSAQELAAAEAIAAAADAAAEATDAANAATDAANAAAEAADAATAAAQDAADSIAALSVQVGELIAGLTAQITAQKAAIRALTNLVIKIQKAVSKKK